MLKTYCSLTLGCCAACAPSDLYVQLRTVDVIEPGAREPVSFEGDTYFVVNGELRQTGRNNVTKEPVFHRVDEATSVVVIDDALFYARPDGVMRRTEDIGGRPTTKRVNTEQLVALGRLGDSLVAVRARSNARMDVLRMRDDGETVEVLAADVGLDEAVTSGSEKFFVAGSTKSATWLVVSGDSDPGPGTSTVFATFEVTDSGVRQLAGNARWFVPTAEGRDGLFAFDVPASEDGSHPDALAIGYSSQPTPLNAEDANKLPRLLTLSLGTPLGAASARGISGDGRLLLATEDALKTTGEVFERDAELTAAANWGFGCERRSRFERQTAGDAVTIGVRNTQNDPVTIFVIDASYRWHRVGEVEAESEATLTAPELRVHHWIQALDERGACVGAQAITKDGETFLIWH